MRLLLTDLALQKLHADKQTIWWDTSCPTFGVRVGKRTKTFVVMHGRDRKLTTLGRYPDVALKRARTLARVHLDRTTQMGQTPFLEAIEGFERATRPRTKQNTLDQYLYYLNSMGFEKPVGEITRADIAQKLAFWDGKPTAQNYAHTTLRVFLNWCLSEDMIEKHPLIRSRPPNKLQSRERVLTDDELKAIWNATKDNAYGRIIRCLMLTGQRRMEIASLQPENVNGTITLTVKGGKTHIIPLTPLVQENLILPFKFEDWSRSKTRFDKKCGVKDWCHHDLRRTLASKLAELGVSVVTIERILGHSFGRVQAVYQRYSFLKEMEEALLIYEKHIRTLVMPMA